MMYHQVVQLLTGARLIARPQGASIKELMEHLEVSRKTVYRLFEALDELGYLLYPDMEGKEARYYLNKELDKMRYWQPLPTMTFDVEDHVLLDYMFKKISDTPTILKQARLLRKKLAMAIADYGYSIAEKTNVTVKTAVSRPSIITDPPVGKKESTIQDQVFQDILKSIREKHSCVVSYESFSSGSIRTYQIHPLTLFEHGGGLYVFVYLPVLDKVIILALERIRDIQTSDDTFEIPKGYDAEKRLSDPFGIILSEQPFVARLQFDDDQAPYIKERDWPAGTSIDEREDGSIILTIETAGVYELKKWILGFGHSAEILEPDWLRTELVADTRKLLDRYTQ